MLLEALFGLVIFSIGILGLVALQARAISLTEDAGYRSQAAMLSSQFLTQARLADAAKVKTDFASPGGTGYKNWAKQVEKILPGASIKGPEAIWSDAADVTGGGSSETQLQVKLTIYWKPPSAKLQTSSYHSFVTTGAITGN